MLLSTVVVPNTSVDMAEDKKFNSHDSFSLTNSVEFGCRLVVPQYGFMQLELIPMLVGFFTYKIATFIQAIEEALPVAEKTDTSSS